MNENEFTDLETSKKIAPIMERLGITSETFWINSKILHQEFSLYKRVYHNDSIGIVHYFNINSGASYNLQLSSLPSMIIIAAFTFQQIWNNLPEWFTTCIKYWHDVGLNNILEKRENPIHWIVSYESYQKLCEYYILINKKYLLWGNWLQIAAEMLLYLEKEGLI